ncbi:hypothetical protein ADK97_17565 [Streptomyces sp. H021]|nr:hypothetical protein ADK96_19370 [Streptomyces sp. IGB124]KOV33796.1 hypothetical protein ADK97_17565 [Streptomyces sp. H021]
MPPTATLRIRNSPWSTARPQVPESSRSAVTRWYKRPSRYQRTSSAPGARSTSTAYEWKAARQPEHGCGPEVRPTGSWHGPPSRTPQCMEPKTVSRPFTDSMTSNSPTPGHPVYPSRSGAPRVQNTGQ